MEIWLLLGSVLVMLYLFWVMLRFTFSLIDRAHERLREEARDSGSNPVGEKAA